MLFSEVYGSYFNVVAKVLEQAIDGTLTDKNLYEIVSENAFSESVMNIPTALKSGEWNLITPEYKTPIKHKPTMPLTTLEKRWLKSLLDDPRIKLFDVSAKGLEDVEPLYNRDTFVYFDKYSDGDDFENPEYIRNFRTISYVSDLSTNVIALSRIDSTLFPERVIPQADKTFLNSDFLLIGASVSMILFIRLRILFLE